MPYRIEGAEQLALVGRAVRSLGADRKIVNEMTKEIRRAVPPIRSAVKQNAIAYLPKRGGLNRWVARGRITANVRRSANNAGVTIVDGKNSLKKRTDMRAINAGTTRAPLFGDRSNWYSHAVRPGFFDDAITQEGADAFREAVIIAVDRAAGRILGG
jgi:hypothetical protein